MLDEACLLVCSAVMFRSSSPLIHPVSQLRTVSVLSLAHGGHFLTKSNASPPAILYV